MWDEKCTDDCEKPQELKGSEIELSSILDENIRDKITEVFGEYE